VIEPRNLYNRGQMNLSFIKINARGIGGKADAVIEVEGRSPGGDKASVWDTTGVEEQGMSSRG
jgi:hypothetical protein